MRVPQKKQGRAPFPMSALRPFAEATGVGYCKSGAPGKEDRCAARKESRPVWQPSQGPVGNADEAYILGLCREGVMLWCRAESHFFSGSAYHDRACALLGPNLPVRSFPARAALRRIPDAL